MSRYDFFIAYASPDRQRARKLHWSLLDESQSFQGEACTVFLDTQDIPIGEPWPERLRTALEASRAIVVLVSSHTTAAFYEQEEIVRAIRLARQNSRAHTVIPVRLEAVDMPYGLESLQAQDAMRAGGLERVAAELVEWLAHQESGDDTHQQLLPQSYRAFGAALRLDRYPQWSGVLEASMRAGHVFFLLHGSRRQNVGLFVERIQRYLSSETRHPHLVYRVRFNVEGITPRCGADWLRHLRPALHTADNASGSLAHAARQHALFLMLGLQPLDLNLLDTEQHTGLQEFVATSLPELLHTERPRHDVRVLLALDYEESQAPAGAPALVQQANAWGRRAQATGRLRYVPLPPVTFPLWEEVEYDLVNFHPPPSPETVAILQEEYRRLTSGRASSYQELADLIDRYLQDA